MRKEFRTLADPETVHETIASLKLAPGVETVSLEGARGRVLAERLDAPIDVPGFDRAAVDGYAVTAQDTFGASEADPVELEQVGTVHAGTKPDCRVTDGSCVAIATGAVLPDGADAVVLVERTEERADHIAIRDGVAPGDHVMPAGTDVAAGTRTLGVGTRLTAREIGLLAALGLEELTVQARPRVGIISTGDELIRPGGSIDSAAGQIYDVNSFSIGAGVEAAGGIVKRYPHTGDDPDALRRVLERAAEECDLVLSSGSTSAGALDVLYRVIESTGELLLHGVAVKPGKPMLVGTLFDAAYVGLPGYPVSALTIFSTFVAPAIREAARQPAPPTVTVTGTMASRERYAEGRLRLLPVGLVTSEPTSDGDNGEPQWLVYPVDKGSGATTSLVEADGIVRMPPDTHRIDEGEQVTVELFSPAVEPPALFGVGEADPLWSRLLDRLERPRYLAVGSGEGRRRLRNGVPDIAVLAGEPDPVDESPSAPAVERIGGWERDWGLFVPPDNPETISSLASLVDRELQLCTRTSASSLRTTLIGEIERLATDREKSPTDLLETIGADNVGARGLAGPARAVQSGRADAGVGLAATAESLDVDFVPIGTERVEVYANADRRSKPAVKATQALLSNAGLTADPTATDAFDLDEYDVDGISSLEW
ncbi:molybdopterin biosynthesis protein [Halocatena halophila]|uniref:molybdopterin biosynthesis protein n=1 Tax=Halocatena halophila TaxID=2814576 RepID=UPI002ED08CCE